MKRALLLIAILSVTCMTAAAQRERAGAQRATDQTTLSEAYARWLSEVVVYIITPQEKSAFLKLTSNAEREAFIEAFWQRRDTNPATSENEYRTDYFKRIAYANEHFATGGAAGWKTDRGRVWITYGKPDEVQRSSSGEVWTYDALPGRDPMKFEFVTGGNDLRLKQ